MAIPEKKQIEALRRAVRYLLAIDRVEGKKQQLRLTKDQVDQLKERKRTEQAAAESCFRELYAAIWLPRVVNGDFEIEKVERGGRPLQATGVHERIMELLTTVGTKRLHVSVTPRKIAERVKLGEAVSEGGTVIKGLKASDVLESFFRDISPPRLESADVLRKAMVRGIAENVFAYTSGSSPVIGSDGKFQVNRDKVVLGKPISEDEIDFESAFLMVPEAVPEAPMVPPPGAPVAGTGAVSPPPGTETKPAVAPGIERQTAVPEPGARMNRVALSFQATRDQIFKAFPAIANLADKSDNGLIKIKIEGTSSAGYDRSWFRNAVEEPLDEADIEKLQDQIIEE